MDTPHTITVLVIPTGDEGAYLTRVTPDLSTLQGFVGGYVEPLGITDDAVMYLNGEGKYEGLPVNGNANKVVFLANPGLMDSDFVVGQVVVVGLLDEHGRSDGGDHDVPESVFDLCRRAGVAVEDRTGGDPTPPTS